MTDEDQGWEIDDGDHDLDDEPGYEYRDLRDDYEPDPTDHPEFERYEHERYLRSLSPLRRFLESARAFIWSRTWKWRIRRNAGKWREPEFPFADESPF